MSNLAIVQGGGNREDVWASEELSLVDKLLAAREQIGYYKALLVMNGISISPLTSEKKTTRMSIYKVKGGTR